MKINKNALFAAACITVCANGVLSAGEMVTQKEAMHRFNDHSAIAFAGASLTRMDHGVFMNIETVELRPRDAVTAWFVVFNKPENCSGGECGEDDIFNLDADGVAAAGWRSRWRAPAPRPLMLQT